MKTSCKAKEPFIKLDDKGKASIIDYNLPQSTSYNATAFLSLDIPEKMFKKPIVSSFWGNLQKKSLDELVTLILQDINTKGSVGIFENIILVDRPNIIFLEPIPSNKTDLSKASKVLQEKKSLLKTEQDIYQNFETEINFGSINPNPTPNPTSPKYIKALIPIRYTAEMIKQGMRPVLYANSLGRLIQCRYVKVKNPKSEKPELLIALELKMASYLGDYGAGKTLKTFSLLPGERTNISIKTYQYEETTKILAQNVLDSYSESSAEDLQHTIQNEVNHSTNYSQTETESKTSNWKAGGSFGLNLGIFKIGGGGGGGGTKTTSNSVNSALQTQVGMLVGSTSHHVAKSDSLRQIEVNSETSTTTISEYEEIITRELENINKSRVLNFVFRQLLQEFYSITYLTDVSFIYYGGSKNKKSARLASLDDFLNEILTKEGVIFAQNMIYTQLCSIKDYKGKTHSLIEKISEKLNNCINSTTKMEAVSYVRVRKDIKQKYLNNEVNGIILDVTHRILRTPSVVVDALLGQGEALDCYNQKLQEAATLNAEIQNDKLSQALKLIDEIENPEEKAKLYKKVFGDCCDVPQSGCNFNSVNQ